jgi:hypothetical protein
LPFVLLFLWCDQAPSRGRQRKTSGPAECPCSTLLRRLTNHPIQATTHETKIRRWPTFTPPQSAAHAARCGLVLHRRSYVPHTHPRGAPRKSPTLRFVSIQQHRPIANSFQSPYFYRASGLAQSPYPHPPHRNKRSPRSGALPIRR